MVMQFRHITLATAALAVSACGQSDSSAVASEVVVEQQGDAVSTDADDLSLADPAPEAVTAPAATATIPASMLGVWDYENGSCNPASDLRLEITSDRLEFYESVGDITNITVDNARNVVVALDMEGEGETWTQRTRLTLGSDGESLTAHDLLADGTYKPMRLTRCPRP